MEPKKVKRAITLTVVIALILILICVCFLFDWISLPSQKTEKLEAETAEAAETNRPDETQAQTSQAEESEVRRPGPDDLKGTSDKLYYPKQDSYLEDYQSMTVRPSEGNSVYLQYKPEKIVYYTDAIMSINANTVVTGLAMENGYTLVRIQDGVAGWILSQELDLH